MNYWTQGKDNIFVAGHRGWYDKYPENTMEGFRAVLELGVDQIETDIRMTKDGELVLFHDETVDRVTDGSGKVSDHTLAELQQLTVLGTGRIPTFIEFMDLVKDHPTLTLDIELKEFPTEGREELAHSVCDRVITILEEYGYGKRCVINTWSGTLHEYIHDTYGSKYPQHVYYPQRCLGTCTQDPYAYAYCACVFGVQEGEVSLDDVKWLREDRGVRVWAGTYARDEESIDLAVQMGAELITCNNPDEVLEILRRKGLHK